MCSSEPARKTTACKTATSSGWTFNSGGISGSTAAPSGTSSSAISASGDGGDDAQLVAVLDCRGEVVEVADVFVIEVDVDEAADLAVVKDARADAGVLLAQIVEGGLHRGTGNLHDGLAVRMLPHGGGDVNADGHSFSQQKYNHRGTEDT